MRPYSVSFILGCKIEMSKTPASGEACLEQGKIYVLVIYTREELNLSSFLLRL